MRKSFKIKLEDEWFNWEKSITAWNMALTSSQSVEDRNYTDLIRFYNFAYLDDQVLFNTRKRIESLISSAFETNIKSFNNEWFADLMRYFIEAQLYGFSLVEIINEKVTLVNRKHCNPYDKVIYEREYDVNGVSYEKFKDLFEIYTNDLGLLQTITPITILKNIALKCYGTYLQRNGSGFKVIKTSQGKQGINEYRAFLSQASNNSGLVMPLEDILEHNETNGNGGELFSDFITMCDTKISKVINGAVIGEDSENGSRSKEEVGLKISEGITRADKRRFENFVNNVLIPRLNLNGTFKFIDMIDEGNAKEWADIITRQGYKIDKATLEGISGLKIDD